MKKEAFTLFEVVLYCALLSFFSLILFQAWNVTMSGCNHHTHLMNVLQEEVCALDILRRDINRAFSDQDSWNATPCIFKTIGYTIKEGWKEIWVSWKIKKGALWRTSGRYDTKTGQWTQKSTRLVTRVIIDLTLSIVRGRHNETVGVKITYQTTAKKCSTIYVHCAHKECSPL